MLVVMGQMGEWGVGWGEERLDGERERDEKKREIEREREWGL